jgi:hypothetical protein
MTLIHRFVAVVEGTVMHLLYVEDIISLPEILPSVTRKSHGICSNETYGKYLDFLCERYVLNWHMVCIQMCVYKVVYDLALAVRSKLIDLCS